MSGNHITRPKGRKWQYRRRVPEHIVRDGLDSRAPIIMQSLGTDCEATARRKAAELDRRNEQYWSALQQSRDEDAQRALDSMRDVVKAHDFGWKTLSELADGDPKEVLERVEALQRTHRPSDRPSEQMKDAFYGRASLKSPKLSDAMRLFESDQKDRLEKKSAPKRKIFLNERRRAVSYCIDAIGDKKIDQISRDDLLDFRDWLWERVQDPSVKFSVETGNKNVSNLSSVFTSLEKKRRMKIPPMMGLRFEVQPGESRSRTPWSDEWIQNRLLAPGALRAMNPEARRIFFAMIETGLGIDEIVDIRPEDIILDAPIPHVDIKPGPQRTLKNKNRPRLIPLVGVSLMAFRAQPNGFPRYFQKNGDASATIGKFLRENKLKETEFHTPYCLRHSFEDRLEAAGAGDRMRAELLGHVYTVEGRERQKYGQGASLEKRRDLLRGIAFEPPPEV